MKNTGGQEDSDQYNTVGRQFSGAKRPGRHIIHFNCVAGASLASPSQPSQAPVMLDGAGPPLYQ